MSDYTKEMEYERYYILYNYYGPKIKALYWKLRLFLIRRKIYKKGKVKKWKN